MAFLFKAGNRVRTYRRSQSVRNTRLPKPHFTFTVKCQGQKVKFSQILRSGYFDSQQTQTSKLIELKFGKKQRERGQVVQAKFSHDRRREEWVSKPPKPKFHKKCGLSVDFFCCQVQDYIPIMLKLGTKQYIVGALLHAKFDPNR